MTARFFFSLIIAAGLLRGASQALQADHPTQESSQSKTSSADDSPSGGQKHDAAPAENQRHVTQEALAEHGDPKRANRLGSRRVTRSYSQLASSHPMRPANVASRNTSRAGALGRTRGQPTGKKNAPARAATQRTVTKHPQTVALNGQPFRSPRDPGARLTVSGGPLTAPRGTAAINGTNMKRKP